jgi:hypothetical protein
MALETTAEAATGPDEVQTEDELDSPTNGSFASASDLPDSGDRPDGSPAAAPQTSRSTIITSSSTSHATSSSSSKLLTTVCYAVPAVAALASAWWLRRRRSSSKKQQQQQEQPEQERSPALLPEPEPTLAVYASDFSCPAAPGTANKSRALEGLGMVVSEHISIQVSRLFCQGLVQQLPQPQPTGS